MKKISLNFIAQNKSNKSMKIEQHLDAHFTIKKIEIFSRQLIQRYFRISWKESIFKNDT